MSRAFHWRYEQTFSVYNRHSRARKEQIYKEYTRAKRAWDTDRITYGEYVDKLDAIEKRYKEY